MPTKRTNTDNGSGKVQKKRPSVSASKSQRSLHAARSSIKQSAPANAHKMKTPSAKASGVSASKAKQRSSRDNRALSSGNAIGNQTLSGGLWTKEAPGGHSSRKSANGRTNTSSMHAANSNTDVGGSLKNVLMALLVLLGRLFGALGHGLAVIGHAIAAICKRSTVALVVVAVVAILVAGGVIDAGMNWGKIYPEVTVGGVDVGGMTKQEAQAKLASTFQARIDNGDVTIYTNQESLDERRANGALSDDQSVAQATAAINSWTVSGDGLEAIVDTDALVEDAFARGRGGLFDRAGLIFNHPDLSVQVNFNQASIEDLAQGIDARLGYEYENWGVQEDGGIASVTQGSDGMMANRAELQSQLSQLLLYAEPDERMFVANVEYTPVRIGADQAQQAADSINDALDQGVNFDYQGTTWQASASVLGDLLQTTVVKSDSSATGYALQPSFKDSETKNAILTHVQPTFQDSSADVTFTNNAGVISVHVNSQGTMPMTAAAVIELDNVLFGGDPPAEQPTISIASAQVPESMTFDEALSFGVITKISEYTTEYTAGHVERNTNIHLAAQLLNNSIASADGGQWSFNDIAGDCNEEKGFLAAGAISEGEYVDEIGGGICQVATTVFNAVYNGGYPVVQRTNHSLYISSYPAGRDAAVSWPDLDLVWANDTDSDVLLRTSSTDTTVTATLYGISPNYKVTTKVGDWEEGDKYSTVYKYDSTLAAGTQYTKTKGVDGREISIVRTVKDSAGNLVRSDNFASTYDAEDEVIVRGGTSADY